ncbi:BatA domain-containing protein [Algoriphagus litoralis]|uniref:BatA domain-containing protein n=1 Tax=Algoriphagus litoralis TaxID=2202829 RepID=UPI000DB9A1AF|nr:BatA domain-containing protein [Algoriphagus litoralis]
MEFLQPIYFWGLAGISIPILIHLWNGRRGKVLDWAAMNWLNAQESQSSRSFKLEHLLLSMLRILIFCILILLAVGLWFDFLEKNESKATIHLVLPNPEVEAEFRFEIEQALEKGEQVFWLAEGLPEYEAEQIPEENPKEYDFQKAFDLLPRHLDSLHIYSSGLENDFGSNALFVPSIPIFHVSTLDKRSFSKARIGVDSMRFLSVNELGLLQLDSADRNADLVFSGPIDYSFSLENLEKRDEIMAAFEAIEDVHGLSFSEVSEGGKLVLTDQIPEILSKKKLYLLLESEDRILPQNVINLENQAGLTWAEVIEKGLLPELILEPMVDFLGIQPLEKRLTINQLEQRFVQIPESKMAILPNSAVLLLVLFLILYGVERYYAYRLNL